MTSVTVSKQQIKWKMCRDVTTRLVTTQKEFTLAKLSLLRRQQRRVVVTGKVTAARRVCFSGAWLVRAGGSRWQVRERDSHTLISLHGL